MKIIEERNSKRTLDQLLNDEVSNGFIHRKNKANKVRFNPNFKKFVGERGIATAIGEDELEGKLLIVVGEFKWKAGKVKSAHQTANTLTNLMDVTFHTGEESTPLTNRYSLTYVKTNEYGDVFIVEPSKEVEENTREITEEQRQRLTAQLEQGRITRDKNKVEKESTSEIEFTSNIPDEVNIEDTPVEIG
jgi:hypothetical protein